MSGHQTLFAEESEEDGIVAYIEDTKSDVEPSEDKFIFRFIFFNIYKKIYSNATINRFDYIFSFTFEMNARPKFEKLILFFFCSFLLLINEIQHTYPE